MITILCEAAACNNGMGAAELEAQLLQQNPLLDPMEVRARVTGRLAYQPHEPVPGGSPTLFKCATCGNLRIYGWDE